MAQAFKETAHLKTDRKAYGDNWERIFGKAKSSDPEIQPLEQSEQSPDESAEPLESLVAFLLEDE